jgi:hypothetical protein
MIRCTSPYRSTYGEGIVEFAPGKEIDDPALAAHLLNDSPGSFEVVGAPAPAAPAVPTVTTNRATKPNSNKREG